MKRWLSLVLAITMVLCLLPASVLAVPTDAIWSGDGDWLASDLRIDNTQSYTLSYDLHLPGIASATTPNSWMDDCMLVIRNESKDNYIKFQTQAYFSGSSKYQFASSAQQWDGSNWTASRPFEWSQESDTVITDVHMEITYVASTAAFSWNLSDLQGNSLNAGTFPASEITDALKGCNSCALTFYRNDPAITISNTRIAYQTGDDVTDSTEPEEPISVTWSGTEAKIVAGVTVDNTKSYTIKYDLDMPEAAKQIQDGAWADNYRLEIVNGEEKFYLEVQQCKNNGYMLFARGSNGNTQSSGFSSAASSPVSAVSVKLTYDVTTNLYAWTITEKGDTDIVYLQGQYGGNQLSDSYKAATDCTLQFNRHSDVDNSTPDVVPENFTLTYGPIVEEKDEEIPMDPNKTPADFGWKADNDNFVNWQTDTNGTVYEIHFAGSDSQRIYREMIEDVNNFTLTMTVQVLEHRAFIEVLGTPIELDCHGGNGNQICEKFSGTYKWLNALNQTAAVTVARSGGGKMKIMFKGKGNPTPMTFEVQPNDESQHNVVIGVYDNPGAARFSDITVEGVEGQNVGDYGWHTDEIAGQENFAGWASLDGVNISADRAQTVGNHRIWKNLIDDQEYFAVRMTLKLEEESSAYVKLLGQTLELDTRGGNGSQAFVKINGNGKDWLAAQDREVDLLLLRRGGEIVVSLVGDAIATYRMIPSEENENLELGIYAGKAAFDGIHVREPAQCLRPNPFGSVVFAGSLSGSWMQQLCEDIALYQNGAMAEPVIVAADAQKILEANADLIVISVSTAELSGKTAEALIDQYRTLLQTVKTGMDPNAVLVLASLPYADVENLAQVNAGLRALAEELDVLYADLYSAMGGRDWTLEADGKTLSAVGNALVEGEIMEQLLRHCTCLAVNSSTSLRTEVTAPVEKTQSALDAFKGAADRDAMRIAVEARELGLNRILYNILPEAMQNKILDALLAKDRTGITTHAQADAIFTAEVVELLRREPVTPLENDVFTVVTVGDSVTQGTAAVNEKTDAWPVRLLDSLNHIASGRYVVINKGIAGTRMCTITDNGMFPAAKDTVDEYIVASAPNLLIVSYGFNDMNAGTTLEEFISTYRTYLREIQTKCPDTIIMICNVYPDFGENNRQKAMEWSAAVKALAEETGCIFSSAYEDMLGANWLLADGVHPTNAGYRVMANAHLRTLNLYMDLSGENREEDQPGTGDTLKGWETDSIDGRKDFSGWTTTDGVNISVRYDETNGNHRIWRDLIEDPNNFSLDLTVVGNNVTSVYLKLFGLTLELDSNGGDGDQSFIKFDGENYDWLKAEGCSVNVNISRKNGGEIVFTLKGKGNDTPMTLSKAVAENNENLELGIYRGEARFLFSSESIPGTGDYFLLILAALLMFVSAAAMVVIKKKKAV